MPDKQTFVCGIDEVGRGSVAGPVTIGACWLHTDLPIYCYHIEKHLKFNKMNSVWQQVRDSKKCSEIKRIDIFQMLGKHVNFKILSASAVLIDKYGIGVCLSHLIAIAISLSPTTTNSIVIDGKIKLLDSYNTELLVQLLQENELDSEITSINPTKLHPPLKAPYTIERVVKGDDRYLSIALASICAKVTRDSYMNELTKDFPPYQWSQNKGYATEAHRQAIRIHGVTDFHRKTWIKLR